MQVGDSGPFERARALYEQAVFSGDESALAAADRVLDATEAALCLARGRVMHARFLAGEPADPAELALFERAAELFRQVDDQRGEAESLFWIGTYHQVADNDSVAAVPYLDRARNLATATGDKLTLSYALRHLGFADQEAGRLDTARAEFEESVRLRRQIGFMPGVAAGLLALAELAAQTGETERAAALLDEAASVAVEAGAQGTLQWIDAARAQRGKPLA